MKRQAGIRNVSAANQLRFGTQSSQNPGRAGTGPLPDAVNSPDPKRGTREQVYGSAFRQPARLNPPCTRPRRLGATLAPESTHTVLGAEVSWNPRGVMVLLLRGFTPCDDDPSAALILRSPLPSPCPEGAPRSCHTGASRTIARQLHAWPPAGASSSSRSTSAHLRTCSPHLPTLTCRFQLIDSRRCTPLCSWLPRQISGVAVCIPISELALRELVRALPNGADRFHGKKQLELIYGGRSYIFLAGRVSECRDFTAGTQRRCMRKAQPRFQHYTGQTSAALNGGTCYVLQYAASGRQKTVQGCESLEAPPSLLPYTVRSGPSGKLKEPAQLICSPSGTASALLICSPSARAVSLRSLLCSSAARAPKRYGIGSAHLQPKGYGIGSAHLQPEWNGTGSAHLQMIQPIRINTLKWKH
ncbi:hypothetical protein Bbelb_274350 [Branchiostoma belcheri]|nr:hypothetical protein Bbelb_274350 [Branchiostoma belcheri]